MEKIVGFYTGPGLKLAGVLETPADHKEGQKRAAIVLCHGPGTVSRYLTPRVSKWLAGAGYVVLRFDHRGFGDSEGSTERLIPLEQAEDIRNAITFMQQQVEVDPSRIGLWGASTGGANATYVAGVDSRVRCMASVSGMGDLGRYIRANKRYWEWVEFLKEIEEDRVRRVLTGKSRLVEAGHIFVRDPRTSGYLDKRGDQKVVRRQLSLESAAAIIAYRPEEVVARISPRAAMWICSATDALVPVEESQGLYEKAGEPRKLVVIEQFEHHELYEEAGFECMMGHCREWFDRHLGSG